MSDGVLTAQHEQIGVSSHSVNEYGATIQHTRWRPSRLVDGRCCGRKPHHYKTEGGALFRKDPHACCFRCDRDYNPDGSQRESTFYRLDAEGNYLRDQPIQRDAK